MRQRLKNGWTSQQDAAFKIVVSFARHRHDRGSAWLMKVRQFSCFGFILLRKRRAFVLTWGAFCILQPARFLMVFVKFCWIECFQYEGLIEVKFLVQVGARPKAVSMFGFPGRRSIPCSYHPGGREEWQKDSIRVTPGNTCQVNNTPPIQPSPSADAYEVRFTAILAWLYRRVMLSSSSYIWRNPIISWTILHRSVSGIQVEPSLWRRWSSTGNIAHNPVHDPCRMPSTQSEITRWNLKQLF